MSEFVAARPRYTLPFAGKDYELLGTFGLIEAVEYAMKQHVGRVAVNVVNEMTPTDFAKLLAAILTASGEKITPADVGEKIMASVGITGEADTTLRLHVYAFLSICLAPPGLREKRAKDMGELIGELTAASPGKTTGESAAS